MRTYAKGTRIKGARPIEKCSGCKREFTLKWYGQIYCSKFCSNKNNVLRRWKNNSIKSLTNTI